MRGLAVLALILGLTASALADDSSIAASVTVNVGETKQIKVIGGHKFDCSDSIQGQVEVTRPPKLGRISYRFNVPYTVGTSLSHTCYGRQFLGTAIDYTANAAGTDAVEFDAVFSNGRAHYTIGITNR